MESSYVLCIKDGIVKENQTLNYYLPVDLKILDSFFTTMSQEEVIQMLKKMDPVLNQPNVKEISIKKVIDGKYIDEKYTDIITDEKLLTFPLDSFLQDEKLTHVLWNHLLPFEKRNVSETLKQCIPLLLTDKNLFLKQFLILPYHEQRIIRSIIIRHLNLGKEKNYLLQLSA